MSRTYSIQVTRVTSLIAFAFRRTSTVTGTIEQLQAVARSARLHNMLLGWWSLPGLIWTPLALMRNRKLLGQARRLAPPSA